MGARKAVILSVVIFFISSFFIAYIVMVQTTQRAYSIPSPKGKSSNSTLGGEAFDGERYTGAHIFPGAGATNVSLDTLIYVDQMRPVSVDLQVSPKVSWIIKEEHVGIASRITTFFPAELLQPETTYNVSGTLGGLSAWWTFTTASSVIPQTEYEYILSPYTWWVAIIAAGIATSASDIFFN